MLRLVSAARRCASASVAASLPRLTLTTPALPIATPARLMHTRAALSQRLVAPLMGGHGHGHDDGHFHGTDFLPKDNVERRVKAVLSEVEKIDKSKINDLSSSWKSLGLDSLDEVEVVMLLEEEFVIDIQDEVATSILTIQDAINYITQHPFAANDDTHH